MTGVTTWNKGIAPAGADGWDLTTAVRKAIETLNTPVPVATQTERDALTPPTGKYAGMQVVRTDLIGCPVETWNGSAWAITTVTAVALPAISDPGFVSSGVITKTRVGTLTQVVLSGRITRAVSPDASSITKVIPGFIPATYLPGSTADWLTNLLSSAGLIRLHVNAFVAPNGDLTITHDTTSYVMNVGDYWTLQASWWI